MTRLVPVLCVAAALGLAGSAWILLGRPRIRVFPDHCDLAFFDTPATCGVATPMNVHYTWTGPSGYVALDTEQVGHEHVVRVSFSRPSS